MTPQDDAALAAILRHNLEIHHLALPGTVYFDPEIWHLSAFYLAKPARRAYMVAVDETGTVLGGAGLAECELFPDCAELQKLYLTDAAKGHGMGHLLVQAVEQRASALGYRRLYLETHTNFAAAVHLYRRHGFEEIPRPSGVMHGTMNLFFMKELKGADDEHNGVSGRE